MAIEFHPDIVSARLQQIEFARKAKSGQHSSPDDQAAPDVNLQIASTKVYNLHGKVGLSTDKPGTLLDAYLETKKVIQEQLTLLISNVTDALQLGADQAVASEGVPEYWNKENTASRIFSIALMGYQEGSDREQFADQATTMVKQAYNDAGSMLGFEFPELVLDTRQAVLDALEQFKGGAVLSEISFE